MVERLVGNAVHAPGIDDCSLDVVSQPAMDCSYYWLYHVRFWIVSRVSYLLSKLMQSHETSGRAVADEKPQ